MNPTGWRCPKRIGFLFPHPCERLSPIDCPDCNNGSIDDPFRRRSRSGYSDDYDDYDSSATSGWTSAGAAASATPALVEATPEEVARR